MRTNLLSFILGYVALRLAETALLDLLEYYAHMRKLEVELAKQIAAIRAIEKMNSPSHNPLEDIMAAQKRQTETRH